MRRLLHVAMTRARKGLVLAWAEAGAPGATPRPSPFYEEAMAATGVRGGGLRGGAVRPGGGPPLDVPDHARRAARHRGAHGRAPRRRCGSTPTSTWTRRSSRYLELIKVAALIERAKEGQALDAALAAVNEILIQCATPEQREMLEQSALDTWLRDTERDPAERPASDQNGSEPSLDPFIPRRGRGPDAVGIGHRHLPDLPAQVQVRARFPDPAGADHLPALRDRGAPGTGALPPPGRRLARHR